MSYIIFNRTTSEFLTYYDNEGNWYWAATLICLYGKNDSAICLDNDDRPMLFPTKELVEYAKYKLTEEFHKLGDTVDFKVYKVRPKTDIRVYEYLIIEKDSE